MSFCDKCKRKIKDFSFHCKYCGKYYCGDHRLPEDHNCKDLDNRKRHNQDNWKKTLNETLSNKKIKSFEREFERDGLIAPIEELDKLEDKIEKGYNKQSIIPKILIVGAIILVGWFFIRPYLSFDSAINPMAISSDARESSTPNSYRSIDEFSNSGLLHFPHLPITYSLAKSNIREDNIECQDYQVERVKRAFSIIRQETSSALYFEEIPDQGNIIIYCNGAKADSSLFMREGDGGYESYGNVISRGELNFYTHRNCGTYPDMEIHEILHTLGFEHKNDKNSIMYPIASRCDIGKIDEDIIQDLIKIYGR